MLKTFKYRLYPSHPQARLLSQTLETCRRWYNVCLEERKTAWEERRESVNKYDQLRRVKDLKDTNPYATNVHSHVLQIVVQDLDKAFNAFFRRVKAGEKAGYPRFKGRNRFDSFGFKEYGNGFPVVCPAGNRRASGKLDGRRLRLSGIGRVRVRWHRPIHGEMKTVRILRKAGEWYACFACEVEAKPLEPTGKEVGIDVGVHHLISTSDGEAIENPKWYRAEQARLRVLHRCVSRRKLGGSNRKKAVAALQHQHERIVNRRKDYLNKLAHDLVTRYDKIALEDLQISNMVQNRHLSKSIMDAGWGYLKEHLTYPVVCPACKRTVSPPRFARSGQRRRVASGKAVEAGRVVYQVEPAHTSKTCSNCGAVFETLTLSDRWVSCRRCGLSMDRDRNAALNILKRAGHARWGLTQAVTPSVPQEAATL